MVAQWEVEAWFGGAVRLLGPLPNPAAAESDRSERNGWWHNGRSRPVLAVRSGSWSRSSGHTGPEAPPQGPRRRRVHWGEVFWASMPISAADGLGFRRLGFTDLIDNQPFKGSGWPLGTSEPSKKVGGEAPYLFGWF